MDARNQGFGSRLFFGSCFSIPGSAPLDFFVSVKGRNAVFLADSIFILYVESLLAPTLDGVGEFNIKIVYIRANADNNATLGLPCRCSSAWSLVLQHLHARRSHGGEL
jgi:hypothetical protein